MRTSLRIVIVDDSPVVRMGLKALLSTEDDLEVVLGRQQCLQPHAHHGAVVDDHDPQARPHRSISPSLCTLSVTVVPRPGVEDTSAIPPMRAIRSRMPETPW